MLTSRIPSDKTIPPHPRKSTSKFSGNQPKSNDSLTNQKAKQNETAFSLHQTHQLRNLLHRYPNTSTQCFQSQTELFFSPNYLFISGAFVCVRRQLPLWAHISGEDARRGCSPRFRLWPASLGGSEVAQPQGAQRGFQPPCPEPGCMAGGQTPPVFCVGHLWAVPEMHSCVW